MKSQANSIHQAAESRLNQAGVRYTHNRRALVEALIAAKTPKTLPEILHSQPTFIQSSLYRNLVILEDAKVVHRLPAGAQNFARFELAEDLTGHHHHLICTNCNKVIDFEFSDKTEVQLEDAIKAIGKKMKFKITSHRLDLIGICDECK